MRMTKNTNDKYANDDDAVEENDDKMLVKQHDLLLITLQYFVLK